jgi:hypothetical protein
MSDEASVSRTHLGDGRYFVQQTVPILADDGRKPPWAEPLLLVASSRHYWLESEPDTAEQVGYLRVWFDLDEYVRRSLRRNQKAYVVEHTGTGVPVARFSLWREFMSWAAGYEATAGPLRWQVLEGGPKVWKLAAVRLVP